MIRCFREIQQYNTFSLLYPAALFTNLFDSEYNFTISITFQTKLISDKLLDRFLLYGFKAFKLQILRHVDSVAGHVRIDSVDNFKLESFNRVARFKKCQSIWLLSQWVKFRYIHAQLSDKCDGRQTLHRVLLFRGYLFESQNSNMFKQCLY